MIKVYIIIKGLLSNIIVCVCNYFCVLSEVISVSENTIYKYIM